MLEKLLENKIIVADGAMGTLLYSLGVPKGHCYDELSLSEPDIVERVHREYLLAGADILTTNTFGANRSILEKYYDLGTKVLDINIAAVRIARKAIRETGKEAIVAGDIGPITRHLETTEEISRSQLEQIFSEQIAALAEGGVDMLLFETFSDLSELMIAIEAAKKTSPDLPVLASMAFVDGKTLLGNDPEEAGNALENSHIFAAGVNCGRGPRDVLDAARQLGKVFSRYISVMPNAGQPTFVDGRFIYPAAPEYFSDFARKAVASGMSIIGGCCGTTPEHIRAISEAVLPMKPRKRKIIMGVKPHEKPSVRTFPRAKTSFEKKISSGFVLTMELDPPRGTEIGNLVSAARMFKELGGDAVNIADLPMARMRMSALGLAAAIRMRTGLDIILHFTARDRNLIGMQSDLLSAYSLGIDNILALRGDPPAIGDYPFATGVFDISTYGLTKLISTFNEGRDLLGNPLDNPTSFFIGVAFNQNSPSFERELERLERKLASGAHFVQTQPVFEIKPLEMLAKYLSGRNIPLIASILPLLSSKHAEFLHNEIPGISIPVHIRERMASKGKGTAAIEEGTKIAREILSEVRSIANGACIMPQMGHYEILSEIILGKM